ncbi:hypothetical protein [Acidovorax sp.]|uniref:hypothetical protein n=1 Tax=Acidovorax sp. TaxID=1872122 RepID=UPI00262A78ED|nr:hypothetical protein [Acidovorax sp.]
MNQQRPISTDESVYLGRVFLTMGAQVSSGLATFAGWMLIGFAAILGTLLANLDKAAKYLAPNTLSTFAELFAAAVFLHLVQRYSAAVVASSAAAGKEVELHPVPADMQMAVLLDSMEQAVLWPTKWLVRRSNRKILAGDIAAGGRLILVLAQVEAWLVLGQLLIAFYAAWVLAGALRG